MSASDVETITGEAPERKFGTGADVDHLSGWESQRKQRKRAGPDCSD